MRVRGWQYYNHAAIPSIPPHEAVNKLPLENGDIWNVGGQKPMLARWTEEFDCDHETNWWYVIKDTPFDLSALKAKRRYEITKGNRNFEVKKIDPVMYAEELYHVQVAAYSAWPEKYRPSVNKEEFVLSTATWGPHVCIGAFSRESGELCGYAALLPWPGGTYVSFKRIQADPRQEKHGVNAALVAGVLEHYDSFLRNGGYICDGERNINHETAFQDYLEKYFGFRKAYCQLRIAYSPKMKSIIRLLYPFRKCLAGLDKIGIVHQVNAVLRMEEICRQGAPHK